MKAQHLLLFTPITTVCAFAGVDYNYHHRPHQLPSSSSSSSLPLSSSSSLSSSSRRRDRDGVTINTAALVDTVSSSSSSSSSSLPSIDPIELELTVDDKELFQSIFTQNEKILKKKRPSKHKSVRDAEAEHGMPWKSSIDTEAFEGEELLYMQFWEWQLDFMEETLTDFQVESCENDDGTTDFSFNTNDKKKARIVNICASSKEYRKIRMTYYDAGDTTQVYNAVLYPHPDYNLPVLGVDLLAFNRKKYLAIVDFQPIHDAEHDHAARYEHLLQPIKDQYESLKGRMSNKFYDETKHFSKQMLFARFDEEAIIARDLFPAFQSYVTAHLELIHATERNSQPDRVEQVLQQHEKYDTYSADRDPATGLFAAMYGKEWAEDFVHNFLFDMSEPPSAAENDGNDDGNNDAAATPPPSSSGGGNPFANGGGNPQQRSSGGGGGGGNPFAR